MRVLASTAVVVLLGASAGCSGGQAEEDIDPHPFKTLLRVELGNGPEQFRARQRVESGQAVARCMQAKGFEYHPSPVVEEEE